MPILTVQEVVERVSEIAKEGATDPERAHANEDGLYADVLLAIVEGATNPIDLARAALATGELDFPRWFA